MADNYLNLQPDDVLTSNTKRFVDKAGIHPVGSIGYTDPAIEWVTQFAFVTSKADANLLLKTTLVDQNGGVILKEVEHLTQVQANIYASKTRLFRSTDEQAAGLHDSNLTLNMFGSPYANTSFRYELMGNTDETGYGTVQIDQVTDRPSIVTPSQLSADFEKEIGGVIKDAVGGGGTPAPAIVYTSLTDGNLNGPYIEYSGGANFLLPFHNYMLAGGQPWLGRDFAIDISNIPVGPGTGLCDMRTDSSGSSPAEGIYFRHIYQWPTSPINAWMPWGLDLFAGDQYNGSYRVNMPPTVSGTPGYFDFNFNSSQWIAALGGTTSKAVVAQDGSIWKDSIAAGNEITSPVSAVSYYTRTVASRWVISGNGRYVFGGDIYI